MSAERPAPPPPPFLPPDQVTRKQFVSQQGKVEFFLSVAFIAFTIILILGRVRFRGNTFRKTLATYMFMGATYLVTYVPGLMNQASHSVDLFLLWAAFLAYLAAVANNSSCYALGDNEDRRRRLFVDYFVPWPLIAASLYKNLVSAEILVPVGLIFWIVFLKFRERSSALLCATKSSLGLAKTTKLIPDFMKHQSSESSYKYMVGVREAREILERPRLHKTTKAAGDPQMQTAEAKSPFDPEKIITDSRLRECIVRLFGSSNEGMIMNDTCVSFAMFWLILAKVAGHDVDCKLKGGLLCPLNAKEEEQEDMLPGKKEQRMFRLVDSELEFLYQYLYTNSYAVYARGLWIKARDLAVVVLFVWLVMPLLVEYRAQDHDILFVVLWGRVLDTGFTRFLIVMIILIELAQMVDFLISNWARVAYICAYLNLEQPPDTQFRRVWKKVLGFACRLRGSRLIGFTTFFKTRNGRRKRTLAQYSVSDSYKAIPKLLWLRCLLGSCFDMPRIGQANKYTKTVSDELENAVFSCLEERGRQFTNGVASLEANQVDRQIIKNYVSKVESQARVILIWHIATDLFKKEPLSPESGSTTSTNDIHVATMFSQYCAYLVAFAPKLLPVHVYIAQREFDQVVRELGKYSNAKDTSPEDEEAPGQDSILGQGFQLHRQLKENLTQNSERWKTLAEFWAEMLLYLALSDHSDAMEAHANHLCIGREFITDLWAFLTHEGCSRIPADRNAAAQ